MLSARIRKSNDFDRSSIVDGRLPNRPICNQNGPICNENGDDQHDYDDDCDDDDDDFD